MHPSVLALITSYLHARQLRREWHIPRTRWQLVQNGKRFSVGRFGYWWDERNL